MVWMACAWVLSSVEIAAAERIDCPDNVAYSFVFSEARIGTGPDTGWQAGIRRGEGERTVGLPKLYMQRDALVCEYSLPNGAFALATRARPAGSVCVVSEDDAFSVPYFVCGVD